MKVAVTYTEEWRRTVDVDIDDDEFAEWFASDEEPTGSDVREFLNSSVDDEGRWAHASYPGADPDDEFDHLDIDDVDIKEQRP